nr:hypothetical protein [Tanacetum cinerariifolium]
MIISTPMIFSSVDSTEYLVSKVDGKMSIKGPNLADVRLLSARFFVLAVNASFALTSGPLEVSLVRESHNFHDSNSLNVVALHSAWRSVVQLTLVAGRNFNIEDLEMPWKLAQERFQSLEPKNFLDEFMLNTFKIMFEKSNVEANIWRDQRGRYRKFPLTRFTLEQMLNNVRLKVKEDSEMSLELLSFGVDAVEDFKKYMLRDYCF